MDATAPPRARSLDPRAGWLVVAGLVLLLASEAALSLPDETADAGSVARFYDAHRGTVITLQVVGFVASGLLGWYLWQLRAVDRPVAYTGLALAAATLTPGVVTALLALRADPSAPTTAGRLNEWEPRGDDVLFVGVLLFAVVLVVRWGRLHRALGVVAAVAALASALRLGLELAGHPRGGLEAAAPLALLALLAVLAALTLRGRLIGPPP